MHYCTTVLHLCCCGSSVQDAYFAPSRVITSGSSRRRVSASGYIEERLKTLRCKLSPSKKAHRRHVFRKLLTDSTSDVDDTAGGKEFVLPHHVLHM